MNEEDNNPLTKVKYLHGILFSCLLTVSLYNIDILWFGNGWSWTSSAVAGKSILVFQGKVNKNAKYAERKTCFGDQSDLILKGI